MTTDLARAIADRQQRIDHAITVINILRKQIDPTWPGAGTLGHVATTLEELAQSLLPGENELRGQELIGAIARLASGSDPKSVGLCEDCASLPEAAGFPDADRGPRGLRGLRRVERGRGRVNLQPVRYPSDACDP